MEITREKEAETADTDKTDETEQAAQMAANSDTQESISESGSTLDNENVSDTTDNINISDSEQAGALTAI